METQMNFLDVQQTSARALRPRSIRLFQMKAAQNPRERGGSHNGGRGGRHTWRGPPVVVVIGSESKNNMIENPHRLPVVKKNQQAKFEEHT